MGLGLVGFVAVFFILGLSSYRLVKGSGRNFVVGGKTLPLVLVGTMLTAQSIDANATVGNSSLAYAPTRSLCGTCRWD